MDEIAASKEILKEIEVVGVLTVNTSLGLRDSEILNELFAKDEGE